MWGRAQLVVLLTALISAHGEDGDAADDSQLQVGRALDLFQRFGYLSLSMKVVARNDTPSFIFREPTYDVFDGLERFAVRPGRLPAAQRRVFNGEFHMEFCDNLKQLVQAYFRDFRFERVDSPWRGFTGSWSPEVVARNLGINSSFANRDRDHCYVLVRLTRFRNYVKLSRVPSNVNLAEDVEREIDRIRVGDVASVVRFIQKFGTHYIDSYATGNSMYQVFVYRKQMYEMIRERLKTHGINYLDKAELGQYFSPWYAEHMGDIKVASGNKTVEDWAAAKLRVHYYIFQYSTLLKIHGHTQLLSSLNDLLQNEAILEMSMKTLAPAFKDPKKRDFFLEVLDNFAKLWEVNL